MNPVARSLLFALVNLFHPRMLWLMAWPMLIALAAWGTVLFVTGARIVAAVAGWMQDWLRNGTFALSWDFGDALTLVAKILVFLAFMVLVMAVIASQVVTHTDRGDEMFAVMAELHAVQMHDLGTLRLLD